MGKTSEVHESNQIVHRRNMEFTWWIPMYFWWISHENITWKIQLKYGYTFYEIYMGFTWFKFLRDMSWAKLPWRPKRLTWRFAWCSCHSVSFIMILQCRVIASQVWNNVHQLFHGDAYYGIICQKYDLKMQQIGPSLESLNQN